MNYKGMDAAFEVKFCQLSSPVSIPICGHPGVVAGMVGLAPGFVHLAPSKRHLSKKITVFIRLGNGS